MPIFDFGREGDSYFYTMPLASGLSLDRWVAKRKPDAEDKKEIEDEIYDMKKER